MIDKAPIQDQGMKDKAKDMAHQVIDKADAEQVRGTRAIAILGHSDRQSLLVCVFWGMGSKRRRDRPTHLCLSHHVISEIYTGAEGGRRRQGPPGQVTSKGRVIGEPGP